MWKPRDRVWHKDNKHWGLGTVIPVKQAEAMKSTCDAGSWTPVVWDSPDAGYAEENEHAKRHNQKVVGYYSRLNLDSHQLSLPLPKGRIYNESTYPKFDVGDMVTITKAALDKVPNGYYPNVYGTYGEIKFMGHDRCDIHWLAPHDGRPFKAGEPLDHLQHKPQPSLRLRGGKVHNEGQMKSFKAFVTEHLRPKKKAKSSPNQRWLPGMVPPSPEYQPLLRTRNAPEEHPFLDAEFENNRKGTAKKPPKKTPLDWND